ncbi:MAG: CPBP family intramembrane metalloprotease [Tissierellia bacterium]|nr:CPBP family intramembrane metalloprotease [Tissierellia bacterium]
MKNKNKLIIYPLGYFILSLIGFGILNLFGIQYDDLRIHYYGIPMMIVMGFYVWRVNLRSFGFTSRDLIPSKSFLTLNWLPFLAILMVTTSVIEALVTNHQPLRVLSIGLLTFLIGFSEEGLFRRFLIKEGLKEYPPLVVFLYSSFLFALVHMANIAGGLDPTSAFIQCIYALPFGLLAAFLYMETKNIAALIFWHMSVDFSVFLGEIGIFYTGIIFGKLMDILLFVVTILLLLQRGKDFFNNK